MPVTHIAIVSPSAARLIASGVKRVESRLSCHRRPPFDAVGAGDMVAFKISGGEIIGHALVSRVRQFACLSPLGIELLRRRYGRLVGAPVSYWRERRDCRYAVLIWFDCLKTGPKPMRVPRQYGGGWVVVGR